MRIIVRLLDQRQLFALTLVKAALDGISLFELLEREYQELRVVLVRQRRERNRRKFAALESVDGTSVDSNGLLRGDVWPILEVRVLALLFSFEVQACLK